MTKVSWLAAILGVGLATGAAGSPVDSRCAAKGSTYPTFCAIPATPTDIRDAAAFRAAVTAVRKAGARLARDNAQAAGAPAAEGTEDFARDGRATAAYPAPVTVGPATDSEAFLEEARRLTTPPAPRKR